MKPVAMYGFEIGWTQFIILKFLLNKLSAKTRKYGSSLKGILAIVLAFRRLKKPGVA